MINFSEQKSKETSIKINDKKLKESATVITLAKKIYMSKKPLFDRLKDA